MFSGTIRDYPPEVTRDFRGFQPRGKSPQAGRVARGRRLRLGPGGAVPTGRDEVELLGDAGNRPQFYW